MALTLGEIAARVVAEFSGKDTIRPRTLALDSRRVEGGDLFCAIRGEHTDGHRHLAEAAFRGACCALVEEIPPDAPLGFPLMMVPSVPAAMLEIARAIREAFRGPVVAITGTVGKTTTKEMTALLLESQGPVLKSEGNWNTELGLPLALSRLRPEHRTMVLELGLQRFGDIRLLAETLHSQVGVITEIGPAHLEYLGSVERILEEKWELVKALAPGGLAVLNGDSMSLREKAAGMERILFFGLARANDLYPLTIRENEGGMNVFLHTPVGNAEFKLPFIASHWLRDFLAALGVAISLGVSLEQAADLIQSFQLPAGRGRQVVKEGVHWVDDSYNANPTSMESALISFLQQAQGRAVVVLGDMLELGPSGEDLHRQLGRQMPASVDHLFLLGPLSAFTAEGALEVGLPASHIHHFHALEPLREDLHNTLRPGDWVLLKGSRGMKLNMILQETE
jgi:UDP-N-acetylmuramoyl-tripeptide--D-alanyl-D-alanine ligase